MTQDANPCIDCISYAICNSALKSEIETKVSPYKKDLLTYHQITLSFNVTLGKCSLMHKYINYVQRHKDDNVSMSSIVLKEIIDIFNLDLTTNTGQSNES